MGVAAQSEVSHIPSAASAAHNDSHTDPFRLILILFLLSS
jgi:hypothetical protein